MITMDELRKRAEDTKDMCYGHHNLMLNRAKKARLNVIEIPQDVVLSAIIAAQDAPNCYSHSAQVEDAVTKYINIEGVFVKENVYMNKGTTSELRRTIFAKDERGFTREEIEACGLGNRYPLIDESGIEDFNEEGYLRYRSMAGGISQSMSGCTYVGERQSKAVRCVSAPYGVMVVV